MVSNRFATSSQLETNLNENRSSKSANKWAICSCSFLVGYVVCVVGISTIVNILVRKYRCPDLEKTMPDYLPELVDCNVNYSLDLRMMIDWASILFK